MTQDWKEAMETRLGKLEDEVDRLRTTVVDNLNTKMDSLRDEMRVGITREAGRITGLYLFNGAHITLLGFVLYKIFDLASK
jgi:hypothetical protein